MTPNGLNGDGNNIIEHDEEQENEPNIAAGYDVVDASTSG